MSIFGLTKVRLKTRLPLNLKMGPSNQQANMVRRVIYKMGTKSGDFAQLGLKYAK